MEARPAARPQDHGSGQRSGWAAADLSGPFGCAGGARAPPAAEPWAPALHRRGPPRAAAPAGPPHPAAAPAGSPLPAAAAPDGPGPPRPAAAPRPAAGRLPAKTTRLTIIFPSRLISFRIQIMFSLNSP